MDTKELTRPEPGDKILQKWAENLVRTLRYHRLASNKSFTIKTTEKGTVIELRSFKTKRKYTIYLSGAIVRYLLCKKTGGPTSDAGNYPVEPYPLGFCPVKCNSGEETINTTLWLDEMVDGDPLYDGEFLAGSSNNLKIEIEIEEEEEDG